MPDEFERFRIKEYTLFDLFLYKNQFPYVGRCYAWALREDAQRVNDIRKDERDELFDLIIPDWSKAVSSLYVQDWYNIAIFGDNTPHMHAHLIPRYNSSREFYGIKFTDPNPKGNYSPYLHKKIDEEILMQIKSDIDSNLANY